MSDNVKGNKSILKKRIFALVIVLSMFFLIYGVILTALGIASNDRPGDLNSLTGSSPSLLKEYPVNLLIVDYITTLDEKQSVSLTKQQEKDCYLCTFKAPNGKSMYCTLITKKGDGIYDELKKYLQDDGASIGDKHINAYYSIDYSSYITDLDSRYAGSAKEYAKDLENYSESADGKRITGSGLVFTYYSPIESYKETKKQEKKWNTAIGIMFTLFGVAMTATGSYGYKKNKLRPNDSNTDVGAGEQKTGVPENTVDKGFDIG